MYFITDDVYVLPFLRSAIEVENLNEQDYIQYGAIAFPNLFFTDGLASQFRKFSRPYYDIRPEVTERLLDGIREALREVREVLADALAELPARQRVVVTLRDVEGHTADEVCDLLGISAGNQRVLLHRGRALVRARLERYLVGTGP